MNLPDGWTIDNIKAFAKCSTSDCGECCNDKICETDPIIEGLAQIILGNINSVDVFAFAPENATTADLFYLDSEGKVVGRGQYYTRDIPKTEKRLKAEDIARKLHTDDPEKIAIIEKEL